MGKTHALDGGREDQYHGQTEPASLCLNCNTEDSTSTQHSTINPYILTYIIDRSNNYFKLTLVSPSFNNSICLCVGTNTKICGQSHSKVNTVFALTCPTQV